MSEIINQKELVDLSRYDFSFSLANKLGRVLWNVCYWIFFRPFNLELFKGWRRFILRSFGAKIGKNSGVYASAKIWAPWNLEMGNHSNIGPQVDCYNQGKIIIGNQTVISQKCYLCASSHDHTISNFPLILKPITIDNQVWIAAAAFIGPGVHIGEGAVIGAKSAVFKEVNSWSVVGGNPAKFIKKREIL
ncbi:putative colanic acid biosynthesis acetyltransferase [Salegentibacter sp. JZCK2]|uniref:putative colanic acid biosynthesis acetyltransferase n=1 Tax=Salegentibacter tibetensis TaxID=2873600 RepID=UPI001CCC990B|nr:putative colanic acid biosynthesis acetyltransferase [Salegentibacter tibetensis]MBZ9728623.1 putative colanic acid biosynthesis acetyltransferase [Salegentibacter tibetensis]